MKIITIYFRLLGYANSNALATWYNDKYEKEDGKYTKSLAHLTTGSGVQIQGTNPQIENTINYVIDKGWNHEVSFNSPTETNRLNKERLQRDCEIL